MADPMIEADIFGRLYPILNANIPLPISGPLGQLASAIGASINLAQWWVNADMVDAGKPAAPGDDASGADALAPPPHAVCGTKIRLGDGNSIPWPDDGVTADDSNPYIMIKCPGSDDDKSGSMGYGVWSPENRSLEMAKELAKVNARNHSRRFAAAYRCEKPCEEKPAVKLILENQRVMLEPKPASGSFLSAVYQPWILKLTCAVRTSSHTPEGESYAMGDFYISAEGETINAAREALVEQAEQKAWEEATKVLMDSTINQDELANETPYFRVVMSEPEFEDIEIPEKAVACYALAKVSWHLEMEVVDEPEASSDLSSGGN